MENTTVKRGLGIGNYDVFLGERQIGTLTRVVRGGYSYWKWRAEGQKGPIARFDQLESTRAQAEAALRLRVIHGIG